MLANILVYQVHVNWCEWNQKRLNSIALRVNWCHKVWTRFHSKKIQWRYIKENQVPVFHPSNTIQVSQAGVILWRRARVLARAVSSPATLVCIWSSGRVHIDVVRQETLKYAPRFTCFKVKDLQKVREHAYSSKSLLHASQQYRAEMSKQLICYQAFVRPCSMLLLQNIYEVITVEVRVGRHPWSFLTE